MNETANTPTPTNPTELARETLRRLAREHTAPTPENYLALYSEIARSAGIPHVATTETETPPASEDRDQRETLKRIVLLLMENVGELVEDDTWLRGQLNMVQEALAGPLKTQALQEVEQRLKQVISKQGTVKQDMQAAAATLKSTMTTFVGHMGAAVAAGGEYQEKISAHMARIGKTEDVKELGSILETLLEDTRASQAESVRVQEQMSQERDAALDAESRIKQMETQIAEMSALVREDPLTHSLNRRGLDEEFAREASRADRYKTPFSVSLIDIDNFKKLNDKRGHQVGDDALVHLVKVTKEELRITDHVARLGGEEFFIMLPNTAVKEAELIITRLQRSLTRKYFLDNSEQVLITFSAGVAERANGEDQDSVIKRADAAMYEAKQTGKNRVCLAPAAA